jgi:hypothetical protein
MGDAASSHLSAQDDFAVSVRLTASTARRIGHQIDRSVQGTFGAHDGLRELVHLGTQQMLDAGASREAIRREIALCISDRPPIGITTEPGLSRHAVEMDKLRSLMLSWTDECRSGRAR